jgi:hypothetical protein
VPTDAQLNALLDEIPVLAGRPRRLEELSGGLTNRNVKVTTPDAVYVARCTHTTSSFLGIDRDEEYYNTKAAERAGVGAPVIDYRPDLGILLLGFLPGKTLCNDDFQRPGVLPKVAWVAAPCMPGHGSGAGSTCSNGSPLISKPCWTTGSRSRTTTSTTQ